MAKINKNIIDEYYLGLIILNPFVYNREDAKRMLDGVNYDPFGDMDIATGMFLGTVTLLRKCNDEEYCLEYESRFKNEVKIKLGETNKWGIKLVHLKSFKSMYPEEALILLKEDIEKDPSILEEVLFNEKYSYYLCYSKLDKSTVPVIVDEERFDLVREEYYDITYRNNNPINQYTKK